MGVKDVRIDHVAAADLHPVLAALLIDPENVHLTARVGERKEARPKPPLPIRPA